jgi:tRNA-binding EMAP/Myf-like protein
MAYMNVWYVIGMRVHRRQFWGRVVRLRSVERHPNADFLSIAKIGKFNVICRTDDFPAGDLAIFYPQGAVVPNVGRVKAQNFRGIRSMGLLVRMPPDSMLREGDRIPPELPVVTSELPNRTYNLPAPLLRIGSFYNPDQVLPYIPTGKAEGQKRLYDNDLMNMRSDRLKTFLISGLSCRICGLRAGEPIGGDGPGG